jgi:TonB family protein
MVAKSFLFSALALLTAASVAGVVKEEASGLMTPLGKNAQGFEEYKNKKDSSTMVLIPAGEFTMGSEDGHIAEKPVHKVYLDAYYIGKYEVTNAQYKEFCDATNRFYPEYPHFGGKTDPDYFKNNPNYPVVNISREEAKAYCDWAGLRLPTEAEWEKAARGTDRRKYPWGNTWDPRKCCNGSSKGPTIIYTYTTPVGNFPQGASPYGVMDMAGNVWEWCQDWYGKDYYQISPSHNPTGPSSGPYRVLRGGSWYDIKGVCRSTARNDFTPPDRFNSIGFRCVRPIGQRFDTTSIRDTSKLKISPLDSNKIPRPDEVVQYDVTPMPLETPQPQYPPVPRDKLDLRSPVVQILIELDGTVMQAIVKESSGYKPLDDSVVVAAKKYIFTPAKNKGKPVRVWITMPVEIRWER